MNNFFERIRTLSKKSVVATRITIYAIGIMLLLTIMFIIVDFHVQKQRSIEELEGYSDQYSRAVEGSLAMGMISMRRDLLQGTIEGLTDDEIVNKVFLLNLKGKVTASSDIKEIDTFIPASDPGCSICHAKEPVTDRKIVLIEDNKTGSFYRCVRPVVNRKPCQKCHNPENPINGLLFIDYNSDYLNAQIKNASQRVAIDVSFLSLASFPVLVIVISLTVKRYLSHPVRKLEALAENIAQGSFPSEIKPALRGDVARLGDVLIYMSKQLELSFQDLKSSRDYMNRLVNSIEDGLIVIDSDFKVKNVNHSALLLTGKNRSEVLDDLCHKMCFFHNYADICPARKVRQTKKPVTIETQIINSDNSTSWYEIQASPLFDTGGNVVEVVEVIRDISSRRELEQSLAHKDRLNAVGSLAASVAHEINTPLGIIMACNEGLMRDVERNPEIRVSEWRDLNPYLNSIKSSVQRGMKIIQKLLFYVRRDEQQDISSVDFNKVIQNAMDILKHEPRIDKIEFTTDLQEPLPEIKGDFIQLTQVMVNLLQNSLDAMPEGGKINLSSTADDKEIMIEVEDDGPGISEKHQKKIFEPFFTTKPVGEGTGLGLYLCSEIVRHHKGSIVYQSTENGSLFRMQFPLN